jgi:hypothetical protein
MTYARRVLRTLGACLFAALGLMAMTATGAQAAEEWLIEGARAPDPTPIHAAIHPLKADLKKHVVFLIPAKKLEILCSELVSDDGLLIQNTLILILLLFKKCDTIQNGVVLKSCQLAEPLDIGLLGHLFLHGEPKKLTYILFEPDDKVLNRFGRFDFPEACALPDTNLNGAFVAECLGEKLEKKEETGTDYCLEELVHHLIQQAPEELFPKDVLLYGVNPALFDGILDLLLSGANEGKRWSGHV